MSDFKTLKGLYIKHVSSDPSNLIEGQIWYNTTSQTLKVAPLLAAWASGGDLNTGRRQLMGAGTQTAGLGYGGYSPSSPYSSDVSEEYNGSAWTNGEAMPATIRGGGACGTQTAAVSGSGNLGTAVTNKTIEYDGTDFSDGNNTNGSGDGRGGCGTQTAALIMGGQPPTSPGLGITEEYDGTNWTESGDLNTGRYNLAAAGTQTAGLAIGGEPSSTVRTANCEEYDGSSWTEVGNLNTARGNALGGTGLQTAALAFGGGPPNLALTESYDGTTWTEVADLATARTYLASANASPNTVALAFGNTTHTEEFTVATTARTVDTT